MTELDVASALATIEARNPADGTRVGEVPNDSAESVAAKARELRLFQPEWEASGAKGLSASVWTTDAERGERVARQIEAGAVDINDVMIHGFSFALPMGGWKHSGIGLRNGGTAGLLKYCRPQAITAPRIPTLSAELLSYPYSRRKFRLAMGGDQAAAAHGLRRVGLKPRGGAR
jgi:acyl-CoA reductase-like NAD-dependent aldehyde dehydrogenase